MPTRLARDHCPAGELPARGHAWHGGQGKGHARSEERSCEVTEDTLVREEENLIESDELLVEEVSIDGMCGVY